MSEIKIIGGRSFVDLREDKESRRLFEGALKGCFGRKYHYELTCCAGDERTGKKACPLATNCESIRRAREDANLGQDDLLVPVEIVGMFGLPQSGIEILDVPSDAPTSVVEIAHAHVAAVGEDAAEAAELFAVRTTLTREEFEEAAQDVLKLARESIVSDLEHRYALGQRLAAVAEKCTRAEFLNWTDSSLGMSSSAALSALNFARMIAAEGFDGIRTRLLEQSGLNWGKARLLAGAKPEEVQFVLDGKDERGRRVADLSAKEMKNALKRHREQEREKPDEDAVNGILDALETDGGQQAAPPVELVDGFPPVNPGAYMLGTVRALTSSWQHCHNQIRQGNVASLRPREIEKLKEQLAFFRDQLVPDLEEFFRIINA